MRMTFEAAIIACAVCAFGAARGQEVFGSGSPGTGGAVPVLTCRQAWMGNAAFGVEIANALGGAGAYIVFSAAPASATSFGLPIHVDANQILAAPFIAIGGPAGVAGAGTAFYPIPLSFGLIPSFAGLKFYAQAFVIDQAFGVLAVSAGLAIEFTMPPQVFVGASVSGGTDAHYFVDPLTRTVASTAQISATDNVSGAVWGEGGRLLFVAASTSITMADFSTGAPVWSTFAAFPSLGVDRVALDHGRKLLWTIANPGTGTKQITALDADPTSGTFGQIVANTTALNLGNTVASWTLSPSGDRLAVIYVLSSLVRIYDTDPASPTFLTSVRTLSIPFSGLASVTAPSELRFTPSGQDLFVAIFSGGSTNGELARFNFPVNAWIDFDLSTPGVVDHLGPLSSPPCAIGFAVQGLAVQRDGRFLAVSSADGSGTLGRVDIDPTNPFLFNFTSSTGAALPQAKSCDIDGDGTLITVSSWSPPALKIFDAASMAWLGTVSLPALPSNANIYTVRCR
jgi:WD40 repeat protein